MALKEIKNKIAYLPIRPLPFAFNQLLRPFDSSQIKPNGLKSNQKRIAYPNNLPIRLWPFVFNKLLKPCDLSQIRLYGLKSEPEKKLPSLTNLI